MKVGNSICYLRRDGVVVDTTATGTLGTVTNGAISIKNGKMKLIPWNKNEEKNCTLKRGTILALGPLMLLNGKVCDLSACNQDFYGVQRCPRRVLQTPLVAVPNEKLQIHFVYFNNYR